MDSNVDGDAEKMVRDRDVAAAKAGVRVKAPDGMGDVISLGTYSLKPGKLGANPFLFPSYRTAKKRMRGEGFDSSRPSCSAVYFSHGFAGRVL